MATEIKLRRGTKAQHDDGSGFTGALGEVTVDTTDDTLRVHDGSLKGGHVMAKLSDVEASDTLAEMSDVNLTSPADGSLLKYDNASSKWIDSSKLTETATGIDVTGEVKGDTLTIDNGSGDTNGYIASATGATRFTVKSTHDGEVAEEVAGVEIGAKSLSYLDLKAPDDDDYDLRIYHSEPANHSMVNSLNEDLFLRSGGKVALQHAGGNTKLETTSTGVDVTGTVTVSGTVDGRDIATDGTKLDAIEASADVTDTANVVAALTAGTNVSIAGDGTISSTDTNTTYSVQDGELSQNNFTDADHTKLDGIEASADVTDTTNVVAALTAGTNIAIAGNGTISATDTNTTYSVQDGELSENNFTDADHTKLNNIEAGADVTDATNVVAALTAGNNIAIAGDGTISATDTNTQYTGGTGLTLDGTTFNVDAAQTQITSVGTLSGLTTGATTVNGPLIATNDYHQFRSTNTSTAKMPLIEVFRDKQITGSASSPVSLGGFVFTGLNEDDRKVSYGSFYCAGTNSKDDGEHKATLVFSVADGSGAADPFSDYTDNSYTAGHSIALTITADYFITTGYLRTNVGELKLGAKQAVFDSADDYNDQTPYNLHMPNAAKAKVISIGGLGPFDSFVASNRSVAQMLQYRGQHMIVLSQGAIEFELPACAASTTISNSTANIGDVWQISNASGGALTIDRDGSGTAQAVYQFPNSTLVPFTNNPTLAVGGTMMLQAVAADVWMIFNPTGLTDA